MKILLTSIGTRGDIEPFVAIGEILNKEGHEVAYSFPEQFKSLITDKSNYHPLSEKAIELIESKDGRIVMGKASLFHKLRALFRLYIKSLQVNRILMQQQYEIVEYENPDLIIHNVKCIYPFLWGLKHAKQTILVSPVPYFIYYVSGHSHIGFNKNFGSLINSLTYKLSNFGLIKTINVSQKYLPQDQKFSKTEIKNTLFQKKLIYTISPSIFQRPDNWPENVQVLGYHERDKMNDWTPNLTILEFLSKYPKVLFLTFGSMVNSHSEENSELIYALLVRLEIPTIINTAAGGLIKIRKYATTEHLHFVEHIPYNWILSRVYAVIHHGGSGTTHLALKYACPTLIIPHIIDQFGWNKLVHKLGVGPKGISINKLSAKRLKPLICDLLQNKKYKRKVDDISFKMRNEHYEERLSRFIFNN
ncbi:glycosyltransferase [Fulvivirga lutea]|uniref:Glycosyltransferase family 1 protein n=1 Tax=Fulvivirga lutea TaxID=2810512 RepID=A0A975A2B9_9BACT|nr:glycosyltransferase [Fulvivirga lutea]QSE98666.1 glycosyltransferase family 1 protein [Fulvivirga lutea]